MNSLKAMAHGSVLAQTEAKFLSAGRTVAAARLGMALHSHNASIEKLSFIEEPPSWPWRKEVCSDALLLAAVFIWFPTLSDSAHIG